MKKIQILPGFWLKIIAMVAMTFDHLGVVIQMYYSNLCASFGAGSGTTISLIIEILRGIGRIAYPIFTFLMVEGMFFSKHKEKYLFRLFLLCLSLAIPHVIAYYFFNMRLGGNPLTQLFMTAVVVYFLQKRGWAKLLAIIPASFIGLTYGVNLWESNHFGVTVAWLPEYLRCDYNLFGLVLTLAFAFARPLVNSMMPIVFGNNTSFDQEAFKTTQDYRTVLNCAAVCLFVLSVVMMWFINKQVTDDSGHSFLDVINLKSEIYCLFAAIPILLYSGKRGYDSKWFRFFSYAYFPMHLVIIVGIFVLIYGL